MTFDFNNKVALVTGAASGLGLATARAFAEAGASVALADRDEAAVRAAAEGLGIGSRALAIRCDVTREEDVAALIETTVSGLGRLDVAYNNAGMHIPAYETADVAVEDFDRLMAVNVRGVWLCMKHELQHMRKQGSGAIVNCSSQSGLVGIPGLSAYTASKHAVIGMTRAAALEYARQGVRINVLCPGTSDTPMVGNILKSPEGGERLKGVIEAIPLGRMGKPEEIASAVLWLCSPGAGFMIGQVVAPDGGYTIV